MPVESSSVACTNYQRHWGAVWGRSAIRFRLNQRTLGLAIDISRQLGFVYCNPHRRWGDCSAKIRALNRCTGIGNQAWVTF